VPSLTTVAKIQKIGGGVASPPGSGGAAMSFIEEPAEPTLLASRGSLYVVADFTGDSSDGWQLISRLLWDTLRESYFESSEGTPLQSLESALLAVSSRLLGLTLNPTDNTSPLPLVFSLAVAVVWGKYLYVAILGDSKVFLLRHLGVKELSSDPGLSQSLSSHTLENEDIVMLVSGDLAKDLTAENLFKHLETLEEEITASGRQPQRIALIIKNTLPVTLLTSQDKAGNMLKRLKSKLPTGPKKSDLTREQLRQKWLGRAALVLGLVLTASLFLSFNQKKPSNPGQTAVLGNNTGSVEALVKAAQDNLQIDPAKTKEAIKAAAEAINNLAPEDKRSRQIRDLQENLDGLTTAVYKVQTLPSFKEASMPAEIYQAHENIKKVAELDSSKITSAALWLNSGIAQSLSPLYVVVPSEQQIYKASGMQNDKYTAVAKWLKNAAELDGGIGVAIDDGVWVLTSTNILRFYTGLPENFNLTGMDKPFNSPQALYTNYDLNNLYVYDAGNSRLVVFSKAGSYQFQVLLPPLPGAASGLVVDERKQSFILVSEGKAVAGTWQ
jgi:hypothetical protein